MITHRALLTCKMLALLFIFAFALVGCEEVTERPDTAPAFSKRVANQTYTIGSEVTLRLPSATGGDGSLTYTLTPRVPGLTFQAAARTLSGTPAEEGTYSMTYRVTDGDNDAATLRFTITVAPNTSPEVHVLSKSQLENDVLAVTDDSLSFSQPVLYRQGDFIAGEMSAKTPYGLLRKVTSVSADSRTVMTADATLEDAIERGTVRISGTLTPADLTPASRAALAESGVVAGQDRGLTPAATGEVQFDDELSATDGSSTLGGSIDFVLGYELIANYDRGLKDMRLSVTPRHEITVRLSATGSFQKTWQIVPTMRFSPIPVLGAPIPIYFTPALELHAGVAGGIQANVSATHTASVTVGVECEGACGDTANWNSINESTQTAASGVSFTTETAGTITVFVAPKLTFNLYGRFGGPYIAAIPSIQAIATVTQAGSGDGCLHRAVEAALRGEVGGEARVSVLGRTLFSARLDEFTFDILDPVVLWEEQERCEEEPEEPTPADELTNAITFSGGTVREGRPPAPTNNPDDPQLSGAPATSSTIAPGVQDTMSIDFSSVPANTRFDVNVRFDDADGYINIPIGTAMTGGSTSGTLNLPFSLPDSVCDNLADVQHQIACYESVSVGGVSVSLEQARMLVLDCGRRQFCDSAGADLASVNLSGLDLRSCTFTDANLAGANLSNADLSNSDLSAADLSRATLTGANLKGADLSGADLSDATLSDADLSDANLSGADLNNSWLVDAILTNTDLSGANLTNARLWRTDLRGADLSSANLSDADLSDANLSGANLSGVTGCPVNIPSAYEDRFVDCE